VSVSSINPGETSTFLYLQEARDSGGRSSHFSGFARHGTAPKHQTLNRLGSWTTSGVGFEGESSDAHSGDSPCSRSVRVKVALSWVSVEELGGNFTPFPRQEKIPRPARWVE
jgi:hypothetical protein